MNLLKAKLTAKVTHSSIEYKGSITLDEDIMDELGVIEYEQCFVNGLINRNNITYVLKGERGSGMIGINGALSMKHSVGDTVHILFFHDVGVFRQPKIIKL